MSEVKTPHSYMYMDVMGGAWSFYETFASKCNGWCIEGHLSRNLKPNKTKDLAVWGTCQSTLDFIFIWQLSNLVWSFLHSCKPCSEWWGLYIMNISPDSKNDTQFKLKRWMREERMAEPPKCMTVDLELRKRIQLQMITIMSCERNSALLLVESLWWDSV